ncbi:hypothetical protein GCM10010471_18610 [Leucobacter komagatae]
MVEQAPAQAPASEQPAAGDQVPDVPTAAPAPTTNQSTADPGTPTTLQRQAPAARGQDKVEICHATGADGKWVENSPAKSGDLNGHVGHQDGRDIIPPFTYVEAGVTHEFAGQNWDEEGQAIYNNGCKTPKTPDPDPEYETPVVALEVTQCVATDGVVPAEMMANLSKLTAGEQYRVSVAKDGGEPVVLPLVTASGVSMSVSVPVTGVGAYVVSVSRVGAADSESAGTKSVVVKPCPETPPKEKVTICHATGADGKWVENSPDKSGDLNGHVGHQDGRDIIPPFTYVEAGVTHEFAGQNWDEEGQAIYNNGCKTPKDPEPDPEPELRIIADQCLAFGGTLPTQFEVFFEDTVVGRDYSLTVSKDGVARPAQIVRGAGAEGSIMIDTAGAGNYEVTLSYGEVTASVSVEIVPCPQADFDLALTKAATVDDGVAEVGDTIRYTLTVSGSGANEALNPTVTDALPTGLAFAGGVSAPDGWIVDGGATVTASYSGAFSGEAVISFDAMVTAAPQNGELVNRACVTSDGAAAEPEPEIAVRGDSALATSREVSGEEPSEGSGDSNPGNDCGEATTPVRSVEVAGAAACLNDTPWFNYSVTPAGISDPESLPISIIWWSPEAYAARDASIAAADHAAIMADGAAKVETLPYPAGWVSGQPLTGSVLWPGATVDAAGDPTGWPGWTQRADGTWFEDPAAPFYNLRGETVVEIRINPTAAATTVYPPATPDCNARPPVTEPPVTQPPTGVVPVAKPVVKPSPLAAQAPAPAARIADTGSGGPGTLGLAGAGLLVAGAVLSLLRLRRHGSVTKS